MPPGKFPSIVNRYGEALAPNPEVTTGALETLNSGGFDLPAEVGVEGSAFRVLPFEKVVIPTNSSDVNRVNDTEAVPANHLSENDALGRRALPEGYEYVDKTSVYKMSEKKSLEGLIDGKKKKILRPLLNAYESQKGFKQTETVFEQLNDKALKLAIKEAIEEIKERDQFERAKLALDQIALQKSIKEYERKLKFLEEQLRAVVDKIKIEPSVLPKVGNGIKSSSVSSPAPVAASVAVPASVSTQAPVQPSVTTPPLPINQPVATIPVTPVSLATTPVAPPTIATQTPIIPLAQSAVNIPANPSEEQIKAAAQTIAQAQSTTIAQPLTQAPAGAVVKEGFLDSALNTILGFKK